MIVKLFCPKCGYEASKSFTGFAVLPVPVPVSKLADDGIYEVRCGKGHVSTILLDNIKFELLFEMGINAIIDGYPHEAVSSFASSLERFYEFYWRVAMRHFGIPNDQVEDTWKLLSKFSERQLGAYSTAVNLLTKVFPTLLNPNKEVPFRNKVIHSGYVPTAQEAISFGDVVMKLINDDLDNLRSIAASALESIYKELSPKSHEARLSKDGDDDDVMGCINILTAIDVRQPRKKVLSVADHFQRIIEDRQPTQMQMLSKEEMKKRYPDVKLTD
jgi:hypothetical protein